MGSLLATALVLSLVFVTVSHRFAVPGVIRNLYEKSPVPHWKGWLGYGILASFAIYLFPGFSEISLAPLNVSLFVFFSWIIASTMWSQDVTTTVKRVLHAGITSFAALTIATVFNFEDRIAIITICVGLILLAAVAESWRTDQFPEKQT